MEVNSQVHILATLQLQSLQHPLTRMLGGPHSWSGHFGEKNNILFLPEIEAQIYSCSNHSLITIPVTPPQLILINQCHINKTYNKT